MRIRYINHSGFEVELNETVLVFDYYDISGSLKVCESDILNKKVYIFVTHNHPDHFDRKIFSLSSDKNVKYVFSDDVYAPGLSGITYVSPGNSYEIDGIRVTALKSTDEGSAFVVFAEGTTIYHGGDLNYWYWNGETEDYNAQMGIDYKNEINKISHMDIDVAFLPLDGRLEDKYFWGMDYAMRTLKIKKAFPMHFWGNFELSERLRAEPDALDYKDKIVKIDHKNQTFNL